MVKESEPIRRRLRNHGEAHYAETLETFFYEPKYVDCHCGGTYASTEE